MTEKKKYEGYGYHGGGRPRKAENEKTIYKNVTISGKVDEITKLKEKAEEAHKTVSRYVLDNLL